MKKPTTIHTAEHSVVTYFHSPEEETSFETTLKPEYWTHVASKLRAGCRIEMLAADGTWWAMLIVRAAGRNTAQVAVLHKVALDKMPDPEIAEMPAYVKFRGPTALWSVLRKADDEVLRDKMPTRGEAEQWLKNHMTSLVN